MYKVQSEEYYVGDISDLIRDYEERSVLGKRKASIDSSALPAPKRPNLPSPGPPLLIVSCIQMIFSILMILQVHSPAVQQMFEDYKISRGVQFELARLISAGLLKYDDITQEKVKACGGSNHEAVSTIRSIFFSTRVDSNDPAFAQEYAAKVKFLFRCAWFVHFLQSPWQELDREEEALSRGPYEGLGNSCNYPDWYGGKVSFRGKLLRVEGPPKSYKIRLEACSLGASCRFSRRFGSWSFLRIKIPADIIHDKNNELILFFEKLFVIWGQVFRACYSQGKGAFLYMTNETYPANRGPVPGRMSFEEFIQWHNPIEENSGQVSKLFRDSEQGPNVLGAHDKMVRPDAFGFLKFGPWPSNSSRKYQL